MRYPLHNLNDEEFEDLVALICSKVLGTGTVVFSTGKDGGRDAKFTGKANKYPSEKGSYEGKFIIQAKHTTKPNASCSDSDFLTIIKKELKKIKELEDNNKVDYYLLFTNRKLSGIQDSKIEDLMEKEVNVCSHLIGLETIHKYIECNPEIAIVLNLRKLLIPLDFYEEDIRETILSFSTSQFNSGEIHSIEEKFIKIPISKKNELNSLSEEYFKTVLEKSYVYFSKIQDFLTDPINIDYKEKYENTVLDIQEKIMVKRSEFGCFDEILSYLYDVILDKSSPKLLKNRRYIRIFLHYMYAVCDIGKKDVE